MDVVTAIETRRAFRSLAPVEITDDMAKELARCANLAASCANFQPERYVFVYSKEMLEKMRPVFDKGNKWCFSASMMIVVFSEKSLDCTSPDREWYLFDTGMATAQLILRAVEMGLVAHPISGFNAQMAKEILGIPANNVVIAMVLVGKKSPDLNPDLSPKQIEREARRPDRYPLEKFAFKDRYEGKFG
jgi:nitroreductase